MKERLDKFLSSQNIGSRKQVGDIIRGGNVTVNMITVKLPDTKIDPDVDSVCVFGKSVEYKKNLYIMMNKPKGVISASQDSREKTVLDILPAHLSRRGLFPAGRLDKNTSGLMIITDDGEFAHRMLSPGKHVYKRYLARTEYAITEDDIQKFERGISYGNINFAPARMWLSETPFEAFVEIREGKFHQIKRMFEAVGNRVVELKRLKIGQLELDEKLACGESRLLTDDEVKKIFL